MPVSTTTAVLGLFFFFPPSFSWKLLAKAPQEGSPASEDGAGSIFRPFTPITLPIAFFNSTGVQPESFVWLTQSATWRVHTPSGV